MKLTYEDVEPFFDARVQKIQPICWGWVKVDWKDGTESVVDLRFLFLTGQMSQFMRNDPGRFDTVTADGGGSRVFWKHPDGEDHDFDVGADQVRAWAEKQSVLLAEAS